jgi:amino acid adenylation domain-containing protein
MYHDIISVTFKGPFDRPAFEKAVDIIVKRHPILRTTYDLHNFSQYVQLVHKDISNPLKVVDLRHLPPERRRKMDGAALEDEKKRDFQWHKPELIRFIVHILDDETYRYTFSFHGSMLDGWSLSSLNTELFLTYQSILDGKDIPDPVISRQPPLYREFIAAEIEAIKSREAENYWRELLMGSTFTHVPRWPFPPPDTDIPRVFHHHVPLPPGLSDELKKLARSLKVPIKNVLMAAHCRVLGMLSGTDDVLTGYEHSGRPEEKEGAKTLGLFLNTVPFRLRLPDGSWADLIREVYKAETKFLPYRRYPMAMIKRLRNGEPLFEVAFNFVHFHVMKGLSDGVRARVIGWDDEAATEFVLRGEFSLDPFRGHLIFAIHYHAHVFNKAQIMAIANYYVNTFQLMSRSPSNPHKSESILTEEEREQLLQEFNRTAADFPVDKCFQQLFQQQVEKNPDAAAVEWAGKSLSYKELNRQTNRLARALIRRGIETETIVAVVMYRGIELLTAVLAIFKAGGVYMPIDPHDPARRIQTVLDRSDCNIVLTTQPLTSLFKHPSVDDTVESNSKRMVFTIELLLQSEQSHENIPLRSVPGNLAYVIYTSGSTGVPKGVMIEHRGMLNHLYTKIEDLRLTHMDIVAQNATQCFDISIWQFLAALLKGGKTLIYSDDLIMEPHRFMSRVDNDRITILEVVPSYLTIMLQGLDLQPREFNTLRYLMVTGETLKPGLVARWFEMYPGIPMVNAYGPTEASDDITHHIMSKTVDMERIPIGKPLYNLRIYIVDESMQLCPVGVKGEICVAGIGVGRGYLKDKERTARVFIEDPFAQKSQTHTRLYRTGDLGCWLPDGTIDFFGRKDDQVKIRGFRIELGEIENQLVNHPDVKETVVIARERGQGDRYLCAYIVTAQEPDIPGLKEYLANQLPDYMVPAHFISMDKMPLTPSGKIDKARLPAPAEIVDANAGYAAPENESEKKIVRIWSEVLVLDPQQISVYDNFFDLGGHSLKAMEVMFKSGGEFSLTQIFRHPTPKELAQSIINSPGTGSDELLYKFSKNHGKEEVSIVCLPYAAGNAVAFSPLANALSRLTDRVALYAVELPGHDFARPEDRLQTIREIARQCVEEIKRKIHTPVVLWGHCSGSAPALEVSRLLEGETVDFRFLCLGGRLIRPSSGKKKPPFVSLLQSLFRPSRQVTDGEIRKWLIDITGFSGFEAVGEKETAFIIRNFRHDANSANEFFRNFLEGENPWKLNAPIYNIVAKDDPLTKDYDKKHKNWKLFSDSLELIVLEKGSHYFAAAEADETARIIVDLWEKHQ